MEIVKFYYSKALHIRRLPVVTDNEGNVIMVYEKSKPVVVKLPRITVASVYNTETNMMKFGVAVCSTKDVFKKKLGRQIAEGRARKSKDSVIALKGKVREVSTRRANELINKYLSKYVHANL